MTDDNHFRRLWDLGYRRLVPIVPPDAPLSERSSLYKRLQAGKDARGKVPGICRDGLWSGFDWMSHETTEADLDRWHAMGAGVGIRLGQVGDKYIVNVDCDTRRLEDAKIVVRVAEKHFGKCAVRVGREPKFSIPVLTDPMPYTRFDYGEGDRIEILTEGRQFIAHGIHPATGKPYKWPRGLPPIAELPYRTPQQLQAFLDEARELLPDAKIVVTEGGSTGEPVDPESLRGNPDTVRQAAAKIRNTSERFPAREDYIRFGYALRGALPDDIPLAKELFLDYAARWEDGDNDPDEAAADFDRMKERPRIGASWLYGMAGIEPGQQVADRFYEEAPESIFKEDEPAAPRRKFQFLSFHDAADSALDDHGAPLIKGLLDMGAMTILYGPSNVGKTFVAMDLAYHVGAGLPYAGMKTAKGCVIYVAAEGGRGAKRRVRALREKFQGHDVQFLLLPASIDLRRPDADLKPLISAIQDLGVPVLLIVVDTLSRAMAGGDENSSVDMGHIVTHFDALRAHTAAHLMVVHHSGKNIAAGARGHSLLRAATDTEIEIGDGVIEVTKQRDLDKSWSTGFALDVHTLGVDSDGDPITSCTVRLVRRDSVTLDVGNLPSREREVLDAVTQLDAFNDDAESGVSVSDLISYFDDKGGEKSTENAIRMSLKKVVQRGFLEKCGRGRWKPVVVQSGPAKGPNVFQ